jgi:glycosyltransferase involved in cell wall biosynthesis
LKVLMLGDSPLISTGFGRVQKHSLDAFLERGWDVASVTAMQYEERETDLPFKQYVPEKRDQMGLFKAVDAIKEFQPDVIFSMGDPGTAASHGIVIPTSIPAFFYVPVEGEPIVLPEWRNLLSSVRWMSCTKYGAEIAKRDLGVDVPWVYHGVDTEAFYPYTDTRRDTIRESLGWSDKFVVMTVAANVRRKQHPRLFEALRVLKNDFKMKDIILYDHTVPFQQYWLDGWDLPVISQAFGLTDDIVFNPFMTSFGKSIPDSAKSDAPSLADLYNAADLFVLPSQVEGFGLPIAEAMACGLPVAVTDYAAAKEVARHGQGAMIPVHDWEVHKSGTLYANIDPHGLAQLIRSLRNDPKRRARMRQAGIEATPLFSWDAYKEMLVGQITDCYEAGPAQDLPQAEG